MREIFLSITNEYIKQSSTYGGVQGAGNVTAVIISFDQSWDGFAKTLTWFNAHGENPVQQVLGIDKAQDQEGRVYRVAIPAEALEKWGMCSLVVEGYKDSSRAKSVTVEFEVEPCADTSDAAQAQEPTPTVAEQLQGEIENIKETIFKAEESAAAAQKSETAAAESERNVEESAVLAQTAALAASNAAEQAQGYTANPPIPADRVWYLWNGTQYVASTEPSVGDKGDKGEKGDKGDSYILTDADKAEIAKDVIEGMPQDEWVCIEKICFGYELLTEKPDDWDENKTTKYYYVHGNSSQMTLCFSWDTWATNTYWQYTGEFDSQIQKIRRNQEPDGTPYRFKAVSVFGHIYNPSKTGLWCLSAYLDNNDTNPNSISGVALLGVSGTTYPYHFNYRVAQENGIYNLMCFSGQQGNFTAATGVSNAASSMMIPVTRGNIKSIEFYIYSAKEYYSEGDYIEIWGVRADG